MIKKTFQERSERLEYITYIFPEGNIMAADLQTFYIFGEAKMSYSNGEFISTIPLSQSFIERLLQSHYQSLGLETVSKRGLKAIIDHASKYNTVHKFLLTKIDELRKIRNPFVHLKEHEHEYNLMQRLISNASEGKLINHPLYILMNDAKEAIRLMYAIASTRLN